MKRFQHKHVLVLGFLFFSIPWFIKAIVTAQPDSELGVYKLITTPYDVEFFGASKARLLLICILIMTGQFLYMFLKNKITLKIHPALILMLTFFASLAVSTFLSPYRDTALMGLSTRYQGLYVYAYYMLLIFFIYMYVKSYEDVLFLMKCMLFSVVPVLIIAILQSFDVSVILSDALRPYHKLGEDPYFHSRIDYYINYHIDHSTPGFNEVSSTLYNANYVGVYAASMIFIALGFISKSIKTKTYVIYSLFLMASIILLALSTSKTGVIVSLCLFVLYLFVLIIRKQLQPLKWIGGTMMIVVLSLLLLNQAYDNRLLGDLFKVHEASLDFSEPVTVPTLDSRYITDIQFSEHNVIITDNISALTLILENNRIVLDDATPLSSYPQWYYEDRSDYILVTHHGDEMLFGVTSDGQIGIYGPRGLTREIDETMTLPINGHLFTYRGFNWSVALKEIANSPWIGHGPDTIVYYYPYKDLIDLINYTGKATTLLLNPHNMYLDFLFSGGIFALLSFVIFMGYLYIKSIVIMIRKKSDTYAFMLFPLTSILVMALMNDAIIGTGVILYGLIGLLTVSLHKPGMLQHLEMNPSSRPD